MSTARSAIAANTSPSSRPLTGTQYSPLGFFGASCRSDESPSAELGAPSCSPRLTLRSTSKGTV